MANSQVMRRFKNKGQTTDKQTFDGSTPMNWVVDLSRPLRGMWVNIQGQLLTSAGTTDPQPQQDVLLKMLGTMQLTLNNDKGDIDIIPAGTRVDEFYRFVQELVRQMSLDTVYAQQTPQCVYNGEKGYSGVIGKAASSPENFALRLYIPLQFIGGQNDEADIAMLVPKQGDQSLTLTITPTLTGSATNAYAPFINSDRTYSIVNFANTGICQAQLILDQVQVANNPNAGKYLPRFQSKQLQFAASTGAQSDIYLNNWERGGLWHAIMFYDFQNGGASGNVNDTVAMAPGAQAPSNTSITMLRDFYLEANTERILEENLFNLVSDQHPNYDDVYFNNTRDNFRLPVTPIVLNLARGKSFLGLYDMTPYIASNLFINFHFDNLQAVSSFGTRYIDTMVLRYQPR